MKYFIAKSTEIGKTKGKIIGNTKQGKCKGMSREEFAAYLKANTWESFEITESEDLHEQRKHLAFKHYQ
jgi:hypothetical protein